VVVSGTSLGDRDEALAALRTELLVGGPIALLLASLAGWLWPRRRSGRSRRCARAAEISASTAGRRLPVPESEDEIARLARTLNEMLERLEAGLERERRFVADASHELRTPLSMLKTELELALRRERTADELTGGRLGGRGDGPARAARERPAAARERRRRPGAPDPETVHRAAAPRRGRRLVLAARRRRGRAVEVDAAVDLELVGDRCACSRRSATSSTTPSCTAAAPCGSRPSRNGALELRVHDDGDGFPRAFRPRAFERFSRAVRSRTGTGAGLGLALVDAVAGAHGGSASVAEKGDGSDRGRAAPGGSGTGSAGPA
jgi:signal transduction histidine kinase